MPARPVTHFDDLFATDAEARQRSEEPGSRVDSSMNWLYIFLGFSLLIVLHEAGHYVAAKATGMRVERFFLFFGPTLWSFKRGETEYGVKAIPLGGYVKITGMNPEEEVPPEARGPRLLPPAGLEADRRRRRRTGGEHRPRLRDPLLRLLPQRPAGRPEGGRDPRRQPRGQGSAAGRRDPRRRRQGLRRPRSGSAPGTVRQAGRLARMRRQAGRRLRRGDAGGTEDQPRRPGADDLGLARVRQGGANGPWSGSPTAAGRRRSGSAPRPAGPSTRSGWSPKKPPRSSPASSKPSSASRSPASSASATSPTRPSTSASDPSLLLLALVSLSLGLINLLPILPLDGGHIFWALVEKLRAASRCRCG